MAKDIVDELRTFSYRYRQTPEPGSPRTWDKTAKDFVPENRVTLHDRAADEIERLRKELGND